MTPRTTDDRTRGRRAGEGDAGAVAAFVATLPAEAPLTIALIALTRFDVVNVAFGRQAGDKLLAAAAKRIAAALPEAAALERAGGAIVTIALATERDVAERCLADIDARLARAFLVGGAEANLGVRAGAAHRIAAEPAASVQRRAQDALDAARHGDGGRMRIADSTGAAPAPGLAADLHRAIDRREIDLLFQPQVSLADDRIVGVEALARWEHPAHGVLGADTLFAAAARADLGLALSEHIQSLAAARVAAWRGQLADLRLSVNVTATELTRTGFADRFVARLSEAGLPPARVTAEITETELIADLPVAAGQLDLLRAAGVRIAIDDFGTGYSSLAYLAALPIDYIKIDRSLTQGITGEARARAIVCGIIAIARDIGVQVIVEGVEIAEQRDLLAAEGCALYQGFLCAGPLDETALLALLEGP